MAEVRVTSYTLVTMGEVSQHKLVARLSDSWAGDREGREQDMWPPAPTSIQSHFSR